MKLSSSSSSSSFSFSRSSSSASFDVKMCGNSKSASAGCLAGILRRILCSGSLPTYPSDQITEETKCVQFSELQDFKPKEKIQTPSTPGLVARLMGLDSMPDLDTGSIPNSVSRSRSMNSVDRLVGCEQIQGKNHRRVKSTLSFREIPTFVELENEEFFILSFENGNGGKEMRSKDRKCGEGFGELKQRKTERSKNMGNRREKVVVARTKTTTTKKEDEHGEKRKVLSDLNGKEMVRKRISDKPCVILGNNNGRVRVGDSTRNSTPKKSTCEKKSAAKEAITRSRKPTNKDQAINGGESSTKKKNMMTMTDFNALDNVLETECNSEDSSPVSVLDCCKFLVDPEVPISEEDFLSPISNPRRKLSSEIEKEDQPRSRKDDNLIHEEGKLQGNEGKKCGSSQMWEEVCRLTEAELFGSNWLQRGVWKYENFEGIDANFESHILNQLLEEVVDQIFWENP
ncbi:hypothetical protein FEM48_Zijuj02G0052500 [Ziziphus jujuba var. spinosa]|uniref:DUF3741 domain-containing protein n=1 Tax=Ziziphus jujuba var. spinosa TaxID=714518 RepID=A0A978VTU6_ZIZJJ|nr:hypothetical protein FEM48_Zijuj02G0052500 [Ziziphus jujuba var. spinosa]